MEAKAKAGETTLWFSSASRTAIGSSPSRFGPIPRLLIRKGEAQNGRAGFKFHLGPVSNCSLLRLELFAAGFLRSTPLNVIYSSHFLLATLASQRGFIQYFKSHFLDNTFKGLYSPNTFDLLLLIPYFVVMVILACYGLHRYMLVFMYYKNRKKHAGEPPQKFAELPRVTVQLPIFNGEFVVGRVAEGIGELEYPREKVEMQVVGDSTGETKDVAQAVVERYAALG